MCRRPECGRDCRTSVASQSQRSIIPQYTHDLGWLITHSCDTDSCNDTDLTIYLNVTLGQWRCYEALTNLQSFSEMRSMKAHESTADGRARATCKRRLPLWAKSVEDAKHESDHLAASQGLGLEPKWLR